MIKPSDGAQQTQDIPRMSGSPCISHLSCPLHRQPRELPDCFAIAAVGGTTAEATFPAVGMTG